MILHRFGLCVLMVLLTGACAEKKTAAPEKVFNIQTKAAAVQQFRPFVEATGTVNAFEEVTVSAEIEGIMRSVRVQEGAVVSMGALLALIDDTEYSLEVVRAEAAVKQTQATLENAKVEFGRKEALYREELVTQQQYDDVAMRRILAEAEVDRAKAALSIARQKLSKTRISAPLASAVKEKRVSVGDFVKNGTALLVLIQTNPLKVKFSIPEREIGRVQKGQDVTVKAEGFADKGFVGKVSVIYPSLEDKSRSLTIEALVSNDDGRLKPGLFAKVLLYTGPPKETIVVPVTALLYEGEQVRVFVAEGDRAREKTVRIGSKYGELMEIMEGLKGGEKVVIAGQQNLSDGAKVAEQLGQSKVDGR
jgi:RND family efflux transporter MFP subunit